MVLNLLVAAMSPPRKIFRHSDGSCHEVGYNDVNDNDIPDTVEDWYDVSDQYDKNNNLPHGSNIRYEFFTMRQWF